MQLKLLCAPTILLLLEFLNDFEAIKFMKGCRSFYMLCSRYALKRSVSPCHLPQVIFKVECINSVKLKDLPDLPASIRWMIMDGSCDQAFTLKDRFPRLTHLVIWNQFNQPLSSAMFPDSLTHLELSPRFNHPIAPNAFPYRLKRLVFGASFNQPINKNVLPESLRHLSFGLDFNQPISSAVLPAGLEYLRFEFDFNRPLDNLPSSLRTLDLMSCHFDFTLSNLPPLLASLKLGIRFDRPIALRAWRNLHKLHFGHYFNQPISEDSLPCNLTHLKLGFRFNQPLLENALPRSLLSLEFGFSFNRPIVIKHLVNLTHLVFGSDFDLPLLECPRSLRYLKIPPGYAHPLPTIRDIVN